MTLDDYQALAMRTMAKQKNGHETRLLEGALGLIGESGEVVDVLKKHLFQSLPGTPLPLEKLTEEIGDVLWYMAEIASGMDMTLTELAESKPVFSMYPSTASYLAERVNRLSDQHGGAVMEATTAAYFATRFFMESMMEDNCLMMRGTLYDTWCATMALLEHLGLSPEMVMQRNIDKLRRRYPDGFAPLRSMDREGKKHEG